MIYQFVKDISHFFPEIHHIAVVMDGERHFMLTWRGYQWRIKDVCNQN